jgi:hypothetical protein
MSFIGLKFMRPKVNEFERRGKLLFGVFVLGAGLQPCGITLP